MRCLARFLFSCLLSLAIAHAVTLAQKTEDLPQDCARILAWMDSPILPADFLHGGGMLETAVESQMIHADDASDIWSIPITKAGDLIVDIEATLPLHLRLFNGMELLGEQRLEAGIHSLQFVVNSAGHYTLIIARQDILDRSITGVYDLSIRGAIGHHLILGETQAGELIGNSAKEWLFYNARAGSDATVNVQVEASSTLLVQLFAQDNLLTEQVLSAGTNTLRLSLAGRSYHTLTITNQEDNTANYAITLVIDPTANRIPGEITPILQPLKVAGEIPTLTLETRDFVLDTDKGPVQITTHINALRAITNNTTNIRLNFGGAFEVQIPSEVSKISLLNGSLFLSLRNGGQIYVEQFNWRGKLEDPIGDFRTLSLVANGQDVRVDWKNSRRIWVEPECLGINLTNERRIIAQGRSLLARASEVEGQLFPVIVDNGASYNLSLDWTTLRDVILINDQVHLTFELGRKIITDQRQIRISRELSNDSQLLVISANNSPYIQTDWQNITQIQILSDDIFIGLEDVRGGIRRQSRALSALQTDSSLIRLQWSDGGSSLLLPESEDFLQIETPPTLAVYNPGALPGEQGFLPTFFNNIGRDCYPIKTLLGLNCGDNGEVNTANGNLSLSITDLYAPALRSDLTLIRTYNSLSWTIDGPFGRGWTSNYLLDFNIPLNDALGARYVDGEISYKVGLDLTEVPHGQVRYTTITGSQHIFRQNNTNGEYLSATLPGWKIPSRNNALTDAWRIIRPDGLIYQFDRAGRLRQINHPHGGGLTITREAPLPRPIYRIQAQDGRAIVLEFNEDGHITSSQLVGTDGTLLATNTYQYSDGYLTAVLYDDGTTATYDYENGQLVAHNDPRAPLSPQLSYAYQDNRVIRINNPADLAIRAYDYEFNATALIVTESDEWGRTVRKEYALTQSPETHLRLQRRTDADGLTNEYSYDNENGFINGFSKDGVSYRIDLNAIGLPQRLQQDTRWLTFTATYQTVILGEHTVPLLSSYTNDGIDGQPQLTVVYDANGHINTYTNSDGLTTYITERDPQTGLPTEVLLEQDGSTLNTLRLAYDSRGFLINRSDDSGLHQFQWDDLGRLTSYTDPLNRNYSITYQQTTTAVCARLTTPSGGVTETCNNNRGQRVSERIYGQNDIILKETLYAYDELGRLTRVQESPSQITTYTYSPATDGHWTLVKTNPDGTQLHFEYDALDRLIKHIDVHGLETRWQYDANNITQTQNGQNINYALAPSGQLCGINYGDVQWIIRYDSAKNSCNSAYRYPTQALISLADVGSLLQVDYDYSIGGRVSQVALTVRRPSNDNPNNTTLEETATTIYRYDALGRITAILYPDGTTLTYNYGRFANGERSINMTWSGADGQARNLNYVYDSLNRLIRTETLEGRVLYRYTDQSDGLTNIQITFFTGVNETATNVMQIDMAGRIVSWRDENGHITLYEYDELSRLTRVTTDGLVEAEYTYDAQNRVTSRTNAYGRTQRFVYDDKGRIVTERYYDGSVMNYGYDLRGNLITITDALGFTTRLNYDANDQLNELITPTGQSYRFNWVDRLRGQFMVSGPNGDTLYSFDMLGRLWQITDAQGNQHYFTYDSRGQLTSYQPYGTDLINFRYTPDGALSSLSGIDELGNSWAWSYTYDNLGRLINRTDPDNRRFTIAYDQLGRLSSINHILEGFAPFQRTYTYPQSDTIIITNEDAQTTLRHDAFYRLLSRTTTTETDSATETYSYDAVNENYSFIDAFGGRTDVTYSPTYDIKRDTFLTVRQFTPYSLVDANETNYQTQWEYLYSPRGDLIRIRRSDRYANDNFETCLDEYQRGERTFDDCTWLYQSEESITYDGSGRPLAWQNASDNITSYTYNADGQLATLRYPDGNTYYYSYTSLGELSEIINPSGQTLKLNYDKGHLIEIFLNDTLLESYEYSPLGRLITRAFPLGSEMGSIRYSYSPSGYLIGWSYDGNQTASRQINASGLPQIFDLSNGAIRLNYDSSRYITDVTINEAQQSYRYTAGGLNVEWTELDGTRWSYTPQTDGYSLSNGDQTLRVKVDPFGRLAQLSTDSESMMVRFIQVENFIEARLSWGDNYRTSIRFSPSGYITRILHERRDDVNFEQLSSIYTNTYFGLPLFIDEVGRDIFLSYTPTYQQIGERWVSTDDTLRDRPLYIMNVVYDSLGNRVSNTLQLLDGQQESYTYTTQGVLIVTRELNYLITVGFFGLLGLVLMKYQPKRRFIVLLILLTLLSINISAQNIAETIQEYIYNSDGHVATIISNPNSEAPTTTTFEYDEFGRLTAIQSQDNTSAFTYDAFGRLASWSNGDDTYEYYYEGKQLLAIKDQDGIHLLASPIPNKPLWMTHNPTQWYLYDGQAILRRTFSGNYDNGSELRFEVDQFGQSFTTINTSNGLPIFSTMLYDSAHNIYIGLDGRGYDPLTGRYLQRDPLGPDANGNLYHRAFQRTELPIRHRNPLPYLDGLNRYSKALESGPTYLSAQDVIAYHAPKLDHAWDMGGMKNFNKSLAEYSNRYFQMPTILSRYYNIVGIVVNEGQFIMMDDLPPMPSDISPPSSDYTTPTITMPTIDAILALTHIEPIIPSFSELSKVSPPDVPTPTMGLRAPDIINNYLPRSPINIDDYADLTDALTQLPIQHPDKLTALIESSILPIEPQLPPKTMEEWLSHWFTYDTLPTWTQLRDVWALPTHTKGRQPSLFPDN